MPEKQANGERKAIRLEYRFDRLVAEKLAHAYELLVPERRGWSDQNHVPSREVLNGQNGRYIRAGFIGSAEGESYYCEPSDGTHPIR